ncbi:hypothetical protein M404DRAFT_535740 [Pisolithus tinctorius Marx 270]|uniref:Uncharacterized protein n=1 Tax=Pisolithus tinctorius Marx 270 TaxID=870435 RepID=A0A0C3K6I6_PISTI|nr:hypothetical protein M404DRAFT_535740 [Pisolithus tinctorius Marx 270]
MNANADEGEREKGTMMSDSSGEEDGENLKRRVECVRPRFCSPEGMGRRVVLGQPPLNSKPDWSPLSSSVPMLIPHDPPDPLQTTHHITSTRHQSQGSFG